MHLWSAKIIVLYLTTRTLAPAWDKYNVIPFVLRKPSEVYKEFLNEQSRKSLRTHRSFMSVHQPDYEDSWCERLLGDEGQTARDFDLL